ncbi:MAG: oligosaccharide flippase family protein, partial [Solirubrobacteraceae bacterium]
MAQLSRDILDTPQAGPKVIRGSILRVFGYGAGVLLGVGSAALLLRYLPVADFGRYTAAVSLVTIVAGLTDAGMTSIGVREYTVREGEDRDRLMRNLLGMRVVLTVVGVVVAIGFAAVAGYTDPVVLGIALAGAALVVQVVQGTIGVPLQSGLRLGWVTGLDLLRQAGMVLALVVAVLAGAGLAVLLAAPLPGAIVLVLITLALVRGVVPMRPAFDGETWKTLLTLTLPFAAATAVGTIYVYLTIVLMSLVA